MECYICKQDRRRPNSRAKTCEFNNCNNRVEQFKRFCSDCSIQHTVCERCGVNLRAAAHKQKEAKMRAFEEGRKYSNFLRLSMEESIKEHTKAGNFKAASYCTTRLKDMNKRADQRLREYDYIRKELENSNEKPRLE